MPKIHTTINPGEELDVSQEEADWLESQNLIKTRATTPDGVRRAAVRKTTPSKES